MRNDILLQVQAIRSNIDNLTCAMADTDAAKSPMLFLPQEADTGYNVGDRRRDDGKLYKCVTAHTSQVGWEPHNTPALWVVIDNAHNGTSGDPVPASRGMEYEYGKYYLDPEDSKIYLCKRGEEAGTIVLQYLPHELIGIYFIVTGT